MEYSNVVALMANLENTYYFRIEFANRESIYIKCSSKNVEEISTYFRAIKNLPTAQGQMAFFQTMVNYLPLEMGDFCNYLIEHWPANARIVRVRNQSYLIKEYFNQVI